MAKPPEPGFADVATSLDRPAYEALKRAVEQGRWPDGRTLTASQRALCLETTALWEAANLSDKERSGVVPTGHCASDDAPQTIRILGGDE